MTLNYCILQQGMIVNVLSGVSMEENFNHIPLIKQENEELGGGEYQAMKLGLLFTLAFWFFSPLFIFSNGFANEVLTINISSLKVSYRKFSIWLLWQSLC